MFDSEQKSTGTEYTTMVALLIMVFIFCPIVMAASRSVGNLSLSLGIVGSSLCVIMAWFNWKKSSRLYVPSIVIQNLGAK